MADAQHPILTTPFTGAVKMDESVRGGFSRPLILLRRLVVRILGHVIPLQFAVITGTFALIHTLPGSFVTVMTAEMQLSADQTMIDRLNATYGLDQPVYIQLLKYLWAVLHFNLGFSYRQNVPVVDAILDHLPATLLLMMSSLLVAVTVGVATGAIAATYQGRWIDRCLGLVATVLYAAPSFWTGIMLVVLFSVKLEWLPIGDMRTIGADDGLLSSMLDIGCHLLLPALALGLHLSTLYMRVTRGQMIQLAHADFVRTAKAKGISRLAVTLRHILRNALLPVVTLMGSQFATVLSGSIVVEAVFNWPGIGGLLYDSVVSRDYPVVLGVVILGSAGVILVNLVTDLVSAWLDPRIELDSKP